MLDDEAWNGFALDLATRRAMGDPSRQGVVRRIAAGKDHSLAISWDGAVFTWGRGDAGQLGHGCFMDVAHPKQVMALSGTTGSSPHSFSVVDVAGGSDFSLFLTHTGVAFLAGRDPSASPSSSDQYPCTPSPELLLLPPPTLQKHASEVVGISCGEAHFGLQLSDGTLLLSSMSTTDVEDETENGTQRSWSPTTAAARRNVASVESLGNIKRMACGASHTLVLI